MGENSEHCSENRAALSILKTEEEIHTHTCAKLGLNR